MWPRSYDRGKQVIGNAAAENVTASMWPRSYDRGKDCPWCGKDGHFYMLQCGRGLMTAERQGSFYEYLRWGSFNVAAVL